LVRLCIGRDYDVLPPGGFDQALFLTGRRRGKSRTASIIGGFEAVLAQTALGGYFRRMRSRLGTPKAITATAHKLARLVYSMLQYGTEYVEIGLATYEQQHQAKVLLSVQRRAAQLGYHLVPHQPLPSSPT
jgi:hypothetical protein